MSTASTQDHLGNNTTTGADSHPYVVTEIEVMIEGEQAATAEEQYDQLQLPAHVIQSIVYPAIESVDVLSNYPMDGMSDTTLGLAPLGIRSDATLYIPPLHDGTIRPDQTYIEPPPNYTPPAQPRHQWTTVGAQSRDRRSQLNSHRATVESQARMRRLQLSSHRARVPLNLDAFSNHHNSLSHGSAQLGTIRASQGVDGQDFLRPRPLFRNFVLPQLQHPGLRTPQQIQREAQRRDLQQRQQLQEQQESARQMTSTITPLELDTFIDYNSLDPPLPHLTRQPNRSHASIHEGREVSVREGTVTRENTRIQFEEHPEAGPSEITRRRIRLTSMAAPAAMQEERPSVPQATVAHVVIERPDTDQRFARLLSRYHSRAAPPTPPSRPRHTLPGARGSLARQRTNTSTSTNTRTRRPPSEARPRPLTRQILESHARNPRINPLGLPWNAVTFVIDCQRLRIRVAIHAATERERQREAAQRAEEERVETMERAILEAERVTSAITNLALCGALMDSSAVLARLEDTEFEHSQPPSRRRERRALERRGWVPTQWIITPTERHATRQALARQSRLGEGLGFLADCEEYYGRAMGRWLFDVWVAQVVVSSSLGIGTDRHGRRERVGCGWLSAPIFDVHGDGQDGGYLACEIDNLDSEDGHVNNIPVTPFLPVAAAAARQVEDHRFRGFHFVPDIDGDSDGVGEEWVEWVEDGPRGAG